MKRPIMHFIQARGYKAFSILNSAEHEINTAYEC